MFASVFCALGCGVRVRARVRVCFHRPLSYYFVAVRRVAHTLLFLAGYLLFVTYHILSMTALFCLIYSISSFHMNERNQKGNTQQSTYTLSAHSDCSLYFMHKYNTIEDINRKLKRIARNTFKLN